MGYYKNNNGDLLKVAGSSLYADNPIGTILAFGGSEIPVGWHLCDGTAVSRTAYAELFAIIGTNFGVGDGSTTFNLPDLRGEVIRGAGTNSHSGQGNGGLVGEHQDATKHCAMETSGGRIYYPNGYALENKSGVYVPPNADSYAGLGNWYYSAVGTNNNSGNGAVYTSRMTNTSCPFIIKCKPVAFPSDILTQIGDALSYSTTEKLTGGRWIDGKPIYRRVWNTTLPASSGGEFASFGCVVDKLISVGGMIEHSSGSLLSVQANPYVSIATNAQRTHLAWNTNDYLSRPCQIIAEYTKTTD